MNLFEQFGLTETAQWVLKIIAAVGGAFIGWFVSDPLARLGFRLVFQKALPGWTLPFAKFGHREKFGNDPEKHKDFSAVTHVAKDKNIPPFLLLHVAGHPDVTAQAVRMGNVLKDAGLPVKVFGARETTHGKINADLGLPDDPSTKELFDFLGGILKK